MANDGRQHALAFLDGGGRMAEEIRARDWSGSPLGPADSWPPSLRTAVSLALASNVPIAIVWGPQRTQIYNDGYRLLFASRHPQSLGQDFKAFGFPAWPVIGEAFDSATRGQAASLVNQRLFVDRQDGLEEAFFTFSFSPIRDETGAVAGLFHPVTELTQPSLAERRLQVLRDVAERSAEAGSLDEGLAIVMQTLAASDLDVPFALLYRTDADAAPARLAAGTGLASDGPLSAPVDDGSWPLAEALQRGAVQVDGLRRRLGATACGPYPENPDRALVLRIVLPGMPGPFGVLVAGVSARRPLDAPYRAFFDRLADAVANALGTARARQQERRRAEALAELERSKTAFLATIGHGLRTPLTRMLAPVEDVLRSGPENALPAAAAGPLDGVARAAESSLRQSQERLAMALNAARMVAWEWNPVEDRVTLSDNAAEVFGMLPVDSIRSSVQGFALIHPEDTDRHRATVMQAVENCSSYHSHFRIVRRDTGATIWLEERGHAIGAGPGRTTRVVGIVMDVTGRRRAEQALAISEERFQLVRQTSGVGFWYCDLPFDVLQWDDHVKSHFHLAPDAVVTIDTFYERMHPDDRAGTRAAIERSIAEHAPYDVDYRTVDPRTGAVKWIRAIGRTSYAADGTPIRFDGVTVDVTERKHIEEALRESELRYRMVGEAAHDAIWDWDLVSDAVTWNDGLEARFGHTPQQRRGDAAWWKEHIHPDDRQHVEQTIHAVIDGADDLWHEEYRFLKADGRYATVYDRGRVLRDRGRPVRMVGAMLDLTEQKMLAAELAEANRRKDEFLAMLAHELRNPLAPMRNAVNVLRHARAGDQAVAAVSTMMERQVGHMARLVDDLLDVSRVSRGMIELRIERVGLKSVVDHAVEAVGPLLQVMQHELRVDLPAEPVCVDADPARLAQVIGNLLNNACKFTDPGGSITLTVELTGEPGSALRDGLLIRVRDTGIGISAEQQSRIFDLFAQVDTSLERTQSGLGIGLTLVKSLVEMHGGSVEVHSEGLGRGSEFVARLPKCVVSHPLPAAPAAAGRPAFVGRRILVVDDNEDAAISLALLLEMNGHELRTAHDGLAAVDVARSFEPHAVLLDIGLPKLNGYEACRRIRELPGGHKVKVIALTGWGQEEHRRRSRGVGFDGHLVKPVEPAELEHVLADVLADT